jgi:hypothetical protein
VEEVDMELRFRIEVRGEKDFKLVVETRVLDMVLGAGSEKGAPIEVFTRFTVHIERDLNKNISGGDATWWNYVRIVNVDE